MCEECIEVIKGKTNIKKINSKVKAICLNCGKDNFYSKSEYRKHKNHFCNKECFDTWQREHTPKGIDSLKFTSQLIKCDLCGEEFYETLYKINDNEQKNHFCGIECRKEWWAKIYSQTEEYKGESRTRTLQLIKDGKFPQTRTEPHNIMRELITNLGCNVDEEFYFGRYSIDLSINKTYLIEVMGTYWHSDRRKYNEINYVAQKTNIINDKRKHSYFKNNENLEILYLWEYDIHNNLEICNQLVLKYIEKKGVLENYQSYNYHLDKDNTITINNQIIIPYMEWSTEELNTIVDLSVKEVLSQRQEDKHIIFKCETCGAECDELKVTYETKKNHYCSINCYNKGQTSEGVDVKCNCCEKEYKIIPSKYANNKTKLFYCSSKCYEEFKSKSNVKVVCASCESEFTIRKSKYEKSKSKVFYCNADCYSKEKSNKIKFKCETCGKEKTVKKSSYDLCNHHFCSKLCSQEYNKVYRNINEKGQFMSS